MRTIVLIPTVAGNLCHLASLCREVVDRPELLPLFLPVLQLVPGALAELKRREVERIAA